MNDESRCELVLLIGVSCGPSLIVVTRSALVCGAKRAKSVLIPYTITQFVALRSDEGRRNRPIKIPR